MYVKRFSREFAKVLELPDDKQRQAEMAVFLEEHGYAYGDRSSVNISMMQELLPVEALHRIVVVSLLAPQPDMALNSFERLARILPPTELKELLQRKKRLRQFVMLCGSSSFLVNLIFKMPQLLNQLFLEEMIELSRSSADMLTTLRSATAGCIDFKMLQKHLRDFKRAEILRIAARDIVGLASLEEVTSELANLASASLQIAYEVCRSILVIEYGTPLVSSEDKPHEADMTVMGMGKLGGCELNFSSDIDIIFFYESDIGATSGIEKTTGEKRGCITLHAFFNKLGELVSRALSQVTDDGFVFRVDLGLRPEGKAGDIAISLRSAEVYYEAWGQSWERTAMLKARPVAGSIELGNRLLKALQPFIYRKYLDYNLIEDMKNMKQKIDASLIRSREGESNIKLGRGGIREIEFFIQALQLVYAGKNAALRERNSLKALKALFEADLISKSDYQKLSAAYYFLRTVEHRIQVVQERQTHNLPTKQEELAALARRCGFIRLGSTERFLEQLELHRNNVSAIYGNLFNSRDEKLGENVSSEALFLLDLKADADLVKDMLAERYFTDVERAYENLLLLRSGPEKANLTERSRRILEKITPMLVQELFSSPDPDMALANLERFMSTMAKRTSYYALLAENSETVKLLVSLFGMSEFLSKILINHPELLDSMATRSYSSALKSKELMADELAGTLRQTEYFEEKLDLLRRYRNEEFLRIGLNDIHGKLGQSETTSQLTWLAEVSLAEAHSQAVSELKRFGRPLFCIDGERQEASLSILGMGKLGGEELNYHSDLDIIFVYDQQGLTDGEKQITNHEYFAKLAQKIISILTMQTREGYVYKIDTRLRPSGNAGPLVTSLESFFDYHQKEAEIWERQALTKARVVFGGAGLRQQLDKIICNAVYGSSIDDDGRDEIHRLRMRMENELAKESEGNYNIKTGRGGIVDVEFATQYLQLKYGCVHPELRTTNSVMALKEIKRCRLVEDVMAESLLSGYKFLRKLENRLRIIHDYSVNDLSRTNSYVNKLAKRLGYDPKLKNPGVALLTDYEETTGRIRACYAKILDKELI